MTVALGGQLTRAFRASTAAAYRESLLRHQREQDRRRDQAELRERNDDFDADLTSVAVVSVARIEQFQSELAEYDTAVVVALERNEAELLAARKRLEDILARAHVLPDGRRVFKDKDGIRVFDEHGVELSPDEIDPDEIEDWRPRWEEAEREFDEIERLEREREELLEYQAKLDEARERLDRGDITQEEFDELRADLVDSMPPAVREQFPELAAENDAAPQPQATAQVEELDITDDMVAPTYAPPGSSPAARR